MGFFGDRELGLGAVKEVTRHVSLAVMNRAFTDVIKDDLFIYVCFLMKSIFHHIEGTSVLYGISWELFKWKFITILDSIHVLGGFPKWGCWSNWTLTEPPALHSCCKIPTMSSVMEGWYGWNYINTNEFNTAVWFFWGSFSCSVLIW